MKKRQSLSDVGLPPYEDVFEMHSAAERKEWQEEHFKQMNELHPDLVSRLRNKWDAMELKFTELQIQVEELETKRIEILETEVDELRRRVAVLEGKVMIQPREPHFRLPRLSKEKIASLRAEMGMEEEEEEGENTVRAVDELSEGELLSMREEQEKEW